MEIFGWGESELLVQGVGGLAFVVMATSFQFSRRNHILIGQIVGMIIISLHFYWLGAFVGIVMMMVQSLRNIVFLQKERYEIVAHTLVLYFFLLLITILGIWFWQGWGSGFAIMASIVATYAFWQTEPRHIRKLTLCSSILWAPYAIISESYPFFFLSIFVLTSVLIAMWRYDRYERDAVQ